MKAGDSLGRYRIEGQLGAGSYGTVYAAFDTLVGERVALKVFRDEVAQDEVMLERTRREVLLARRVQHPCVCRVHDLQQEGGCTFIVMELLDGVCLSDEVDAGALEPRRAAHIVRSVCAALAAAHAQGVLHRDVKPSNVMIDKAGLVKLVDFGIATSEGLHNLTRPGGTVGTIGFLAPELWEGGEASVASDVFAAGVLLYGCLTRRLPWRGKGLQLVDQMRASSPPPPSVYAPGVDAELDQITLRACAVDPAARFPTASAFADALGAWLDTTPLHASATPASAGDGAFVRDPTLEVQPRTETAPVPAGRWSSLRAVAAVGAISAAAALAWWAVGASPPVALTHVVDAGGGAPPDATPPAHDAAARERGASADRDGGSAPDIAIGAQSADNTDTTQHTDTAASEIRVVASATRRVDALRRDLARTMARRGLVAGDDEELDRAARARRSDPRAPALLQSAITSAEKLPIDRALVERKLARLQKRAEGNQDPRLKELASGIAADIASARYVDANTRLNRALTVAAQ